MSRYRLTSKGKRTITALFLMLSSGVVLAIIFEKGLIYGLIGIFTASAIGFLFEIYLGFRSMVKRNDLKNRMKQTLDRDYSKELIIQEEQDNNESNSESEFDLNEDIVEEHIKEEIKEAEEINENDPTFVDNEITTEAQLSENVSKIEPDHEEEEEQEIVEDIIEATTVEEKEEENLENEAEEEQETSAYPVFRPFGNTIDKALEEYDSKPKEEPTKEAEEPVEIVQTIESPYKTKQEDTVKYRKLSEFVRKVDRQTFDWLHDLQIEDERADNLYLDYLLITEKGLFVIHDMEDYEVISGNTEAEHWTCYRTNVDYQNRKSTSIDNPVKGLDLAVEAVKQILFEFDLLLPVYGLFITQDLCELHISDEGALRAIKLNSLSPFIENKNGIPDITEEMIGILKEIFVIKDEISRENSIS